jgi:RNA polymerase sigma-70 factor (ECF subfamily)
MDDESRLATALVRRDRRAWAAVYDRHVGAVFGLVYHLVGRDQVLAEEVSQEAWLLAIEQVDRFDPARGAFRDWLLGIARHRALHRRWRERIGAELHEVPSGALAPPDLMEDKERAGMVRAALLCLHDDRRRVLLDKYAEGLSVAEIAARTGKSAKAVESLLSRARAQLRALLEPYFSSPTGGDAHEPADARTAR